MLYPNNFEQKIGFDKIRDLLKKECLSELGISYVNRIVFATDTAGIQKLLFQTDEFLKILKGPDVFPSQNFIDVSEALDIAKTEGAILNEKAFWDIKVSLGAIQQCQIFIKKLDENIYPNLKELSAPVVLDKELIKSIERIIDETGHVRDNASKELSSIRSELLAEQSSLRKKLDSLLRSSKAEGFSPDDVSLTIRSGRMVIPVFAENKRKIKGLIHDESATGQTVYIEPIEVFDANNRIRELENDERREIIRILDALTTELRKGIPELRKAYRFLGIIDFIRAKAKFGQKINASLQRLDRNNLIKWNKTYHPLLYLSQKLAGKSIIPLSITLNQNQRILVISGPNAGGKSVVLKTLGLLQYMNQCGLLVPNGEQCSFGNFNDIFIDIGDEQSIENDLSTYSSHLTNMREIIKNSGKNSLVLIDEFGTGTDPQYGGAIAESILEELVKNQTCAVINTHYSNLKYYAENTQGVVNGAMKYDYEQLTPLYELEIGKPGNSFALEIAQKIGLPQNLLNRAKNKIGDKKLNVDRLVKELQIEKEQFATKNEELFKSQKNLETSVNQYQELKEFLEKSKTDILQNARLEAKKLVQEAKHQTQGIIKQLKETTKYDAVHIETNRNELRKLEDLLEDAKEAKSKLNQQEKSKQAIKAGDKVNHAIKAGDKVKVEGQSGTFKIIDIKGKEATLTLGQITTKVKTERLSKILEEEKEEKPFAITRVRGIDINERMAYFSSTLDLRGKRADEAISLLDSYLDTSLLLASNEVRILHGKGDGILRKFVREHLKRQSFIESFKDEQVEFGGEGITVVKFK